MPVKTCVTPGSPPPEPISVARNVTPPSGPPTHTSIRRSGTADGATDEAGGMIKKLRDCGFLTRDARIKERKKYGLRGARRGTQFSKH